MKESNFTFIFQLTLLLEPYCDLVSRIIVCCIVDSNGKLQAIRDNRLFPVIAGSNEIQTITTKITNKSPKTCYGHIGDTSIGMDQFEDLVDI